MCEIIYKDKSYLIQGAVSEVYCEMGTGFLEAVYQECLEIELNIRNIPFIALKELEISYHGRILQKKYIPDLICYEKIVLELKTKKEITAEDEAQLFNYLKATGHKLGMIINFGHFPKAQIKRIVR